MYCKIKYYLLTILVKTTFKSNKFRSRTLNWSQPWTASWSRGFGQSTDSSATKQSPSRTSSTSSRSSRTWTRSMACGMKARKMTTSQVGGATVTMLTARQPTQTQKKGKRWEKSFFRRHHNRHWFHTCCHYYLHCHHCQSNVHLQTTCFFERSTSK